MRIVRPICLLTCTLLAATAVQAQTSAAAKADRAALQGDWVIVSASRNGKPSPPLSKNSTRTTHGDTTTVRIGGQMVLLATFVLHPSKNPKAIDHHVLGGNPPPGSVQLGIYEVKGDTVRFCFALLGSPRPGEFATHQGDQRTCSVWSRAKP